MSTDSHRFRSFSTESHLSKKKQPLPKFFLFSQNTLHSSMTQLKILFKNAFILSVEKCLIFSCYHSLPPLHLSLSLSLSFSFSLSFSLSLSLVCKSVSLMVYEYHDKLGRLTQSPVVACFGPQTDSNAAKPCSFSMLFHS